MLTLRKMILGVALVAAMSASPRAAARAGEIGVGKPYPEIRLPTVEGDRTLSLSSFRGRKVLLIEFASW